MCGHLTCRNCGREQTDPRIVAAYEERYPGKTPEDIPYVCAECMDAGDWHLSCPQCGSLSPEWVDESAYCDAMVFECMKCGHRFEVEEMDEREIV